MLLFILNSYIFIFPYFKHSEMIKESNGSEVPSTQPKINSALDRIQQWKINDEKAQKIHIMLAEMIAVDNQTISFVENEGLKRLMTHLVPKYNVSSCYVIFYVK